MNLGDILAKVEQLANMSANPLDELNRPTYWPIHREDLANILAKSALHAQFANISANPPSSKAIARKWPIYQRNKMR